MSETLIRINDNGRVIVETENRGVKSFKQITPDSLAECINQSLLRGAVHTGLLPKNCISFSAYDNGNKEVVLVEHAHDEPVYVGFNREKYFKNCKNAYFKYGGVGIRFAEPLYRAGLLSYEEEEINGRKVVPFDVILKHTPAAPKDPEVIKEIIDEGLISDEGAFVCEAYGQKDGKNIMVDLHVFAPGLVEAYDKAKMSGEMYLTGQGAFLFTKLFVNDKITQTGLISSDMLDDEQVAKVLSSDLTIDEKLQKLIYKSNNRGGTDNISIAYLNKGGVR